ncbi:hypothetical protein QQ054_10780 [Oscillatoria amoena NRMC-F 0135]|nr:hypothetical protein [Oscillatoria amoena NRMC-F 0135]
MITFTIQRDLLGNSTISYYDPFEKRQFDRVYIGDERENSINILRNVIYEGAKRMASQREQNLKHAPDGLTYSDRIHKMEALRKSLTVLKSAHLPFFIDKALTVKEQLTDIQPSKSSKFYAGYINRLDTLDKLIAQLKTIHNAIN